jgi:hypothetical protein
VVILGNESSPAPFWARGILSSCEMYGSLIEGDDVREGVIHCVYKFSIGVRV